MSLRHGGLFEGYGGTTMAAALALGELDTRWVSDIKPASVRLLAHHRPEVPNLGDMTGIDYTAAPPIDVLTASWPCQPHSSAGRRLGEADPRALWPHVHRAIAEARPAVFLGENVARIAGGGELRRVVRSLAGLGYVGAWRVQRASDVRACHERPRLFIAALDPGQPVSLPACPPAGAVPLSTSAGRSVKLLPTPTQRDGRRGAGWGDLPGRPLSETIHRLVDGPGEYEPAISRHEQAFGTSAPPPLVPGRLGSPVLAPRFAEWMMGVPAGHVCDVPGLSRGEQISLLGDGVVPAQGAAAFRFLLDHLAQRLAVAA